MDENKAINIAVDTYDELLREFILASMALTEVAVQPTNSGKSTYGKIEQVLPGKPFALKGHGIPVECKVTVIWSDLQKTGKDYETARASRAATIQTRLNRDMELAKRYGVAPNSADGE